MKQTVCTIIAGPNGAGKSTFAEMHARRVKGDFNFVAVALDYIYSDLCISTA